MYFSICLAMSQDIDECLTPEERQNSLLWISQADSGCDDSLLLSAGVLHGLPMVEAETMGIWP